jgi:hypothetical protein
MKKALNISVAVAFSLCSLILFFMSCAGNSSPRNKKDTKQVYVKEDIIERDIPEWFSRNPRLQDRVQKGQTMLQLEDLHNGFDSLQIRIYIACISDTENTISIARRNGGWTSTFLFYKFIHDENGEVKSVQFRKDHRIPKSGWDKFSDSLLKTGITELPDYETFKSGYSHPGSDADGVAVEIATRATYRLYQYPELLSNIRLKDGPGKLEEALLLIEREFGFQRVCR